MTGAVIVLDESKSERQRKLNHINWSFFVFFSPQCFEGFCPARKSWHHQHSYECISWCRWLNLQFGWKSSRTNAARHWHLVVRAKTADLFFGKPRMWSINLDSFSGLQWLLWWDPDLPLPQQLLREVCDITAGDRDMFNTAADDVTFSLETQATCIRERRAVLTDGLEWPHLPLGWRAWHRLHCQLQFQSVFAHRLVWTSTRQPAPGQPESKQGYTVEAKPKD